MLFSILQGGSLSDMLVSLLLTLPVILFALSLHETAHGFAAWKCGDSTAYNLGRLTLNPLKHLDPLGFVCMLVFGFGWAKPVPINSRNFRNPKKGTVITAAAGPLSNLILGLLSACSYGLTNAYYNFVYYRFGEGFLFTAVGWAGVLFYYGATINILFALFNLIPIPPFDGSRIALAFLPERAYFGLMRNERKIMFGLLILLLILSRLGISPFGLLTNWIVTGVATPVGNCFWKLFAQSL